MEVILLEKIRKLGNIGAAVSVRPGYARNYLIPYGKAILATKTNSEKFAVMKEALEQTAAQSLSEAKQRAELFTGIEIALAVKTTEEGKLFGSVRAGDIVEALVQQGRTVEKHEVILPHGAIRHIGDYDISLSLHSEVSCVVKLRVIPAVDHAAVRSE